MDFRTEPAGLYARALALASLLMGLGDAARLLGVGSGAVSPLETLGPGGFVLLAVFCLARLFAAVGLWIQVRWGAILLAGALFAEVTLHLLGSTWVTLSLFGFLFKLAVMLATILLLVLAHVLSRRHAMD